MKEYKIGDKIKILKNVRCLTRPMSFTKLTLNEEDFYGIIMDINDTPNKKYPEFSIANFLEDRNINVDIFLKKFIVVYNEETGCFLLPFKEDIDYKIIEDTSFKRGKNRKIFIMGDNENERD